MENCRRVSVANSTFVEMDNLRSIELRNIGNLSLVQQSFEMSRQISVETRISISNSNIDVLPSSVFRGNINTISLQNVRVGQVQAFAFANINKTETVEIKNSRIDELEAQAFKKFDVTYLYIIGTSLGNIVPSKAINDIEVYANFILDGCEMGTVRPSAFIIKRAETVAIENCLIANLEGEAFDVSAQDTVLIQNNTFGNVALGAFFGFKADRHTNSAAVLEFKDNSITSFEQGSLYFDQSSFRVHMENLLISQPCDCQQIPLWKNNILNHTNIHFNVYSSQTSFTDIQSQEDPEILLCLLNASGQPVSFTNFQARSCTLTKPILIMALGLAGFGLLLIILGVILTTYFCRRKHRQQTTNRWISVPTNVTSKDVTATDPPLDSTITMVVPDGRLYKETEFHVIVEKAQPLTTEL